MSLVYITPILCLYLFLRIYLPNTIEFGFDQPMLAERVLHFLQNPSFLNSYDFVGFNPWGYPSWGPVQIFFYSPFVAVFKDPQLLSLLISFFNIVSVIFTFLIGVRYFSKTTGIVAAVLLASHPWWVIFSRMIYQPTPVPTFISISLYLLFFNIKKEGSKYIFLLVITWAVLLQFYTHTVIFVLMSISVCLYYCRKINIKYFIFGLFVAGVLFLPYLVYFVTNNSLMEFVSVYRKFQEISESRIDLFIMSIKEYVLVMSGNSFKWQLGYGYEDFIKLKLEIEYFTIYTTAFLIIVLIHNSIFLLLDKKRRLFRAVLLITSVSPILFLTIIRSPIVLPRYFILGVPATALLSGLFIDEVMNFTQRIKKRLIGVFFVILGGLVVFYWFIFIVYYNQFILYYSYDKGFLSYYADIPYSFAKRTLNRVISDSNSRGYFSPFISDNPNQCSGQPQSLAISYTWKYIFKQENRRNLDNECYYIDYTPVSEKENSQIIGQFGPYVLYRINN